MVPKILFYYLMRLMRIEKLSTWPSLRTTTLIGLSAQNHSGDLKQTKSDQSRARYSQLQKSVPKIVPKIVLKKVLQKVEKVSQKPCPNKCPKKVSQKCRKKYPKECSKKVSQKISLSVKFDVCISPGEKHHHCGECVFMIIQQQPLIWEQKQLPASNNNTLNSSPILILSVLTL